MLCFTILVVMTILIYVIIYACMYVCMHASKAISSYGNIMCI